MVPDFVLDGEAIVQLVKGHKEAEEVMKMNCQEEWHGNEVQGVIPDFVSSIAKWGKIALLLEQVVDEDEDEITDQEAVHIPLEGHEQ